MNSTLDQLEAEAMSLSATDRSMLAERLVESLASKDDAEVQRAWSRLALKRRDEIRSGAVSGIPGVEGSAMVRSLVG
jgi:hypothetical protein